jgi:transposase
MTSMTRTTVGVTGGVDTHGHSHHAAVIDHLGRQLGDREFPASPVGRALVEWLQGHGGVDRVGAEGTGTYGAGLARQLREAGILIVEVDRPDRRARRAHGKSDPLDAYSAARAALSGAASVVPKLRDGRVEAIRALRVARSSAVKARSQATNQIKSLIVTGPAEARG